MIVDTAGRLHTQIQPDGRARKNEAHRRQARSRRAARRFAGARRHHRAKTASSQAREFTAAAGVTGIVLTKLDGTARGGIVVPIVRELGLPVRFVGTGETAEDLVPFDAPDIRQFPVRLNGLAERFRLSDSALSFHLTDRWGSCHSERSEECLLPQSKKLREILARESGAQNDSVYPLGGLLRGARERGGRELL